MICNTCLRNEGNYLVLVLNPSTNHKLNKNISISAGSFHLYCTVSVKHSQYVRE